MPLESSAITMPVTAASWPTTAFATSARTARSACNAAAASGDIADAAGCVGTGVSGDEATSVAGSVSS